jgi:GR25 family glycosyltransferase involved in LPS biosynthesis
MVPFVRFINRDQDTQRRAFVEKNAAEQGFALERFAAINGHADDFLDRYGHLVGGEIGRGTQACFLSHAAIWEKIVSGPEPFGLVSEDDVVFLRPASDLAPYLAGLGRFDLIFLNLRSVVYREFAQTDRLVPLAPLGLTWAAAMDRPRDPSHPRFGRNIRDIRAPGTDFYAITRSGAARLLAEFEKDRATTNVDCWMYYKCLLPEDILAHRRRFIPRSLRQAGVAPAEPPVRAAIVDVPFSDTDTRRAGGRARNPLPSKTADTDDRQPAA